MFLLSYMVNLFVFVEREKVKNYSAVDVLHLLILFYSIPWTSVRYHFKVTADIYMFYKFHGRKEAWQIAFFCMWSRISFGQKKAFLSVLMTEDVLINFEVCAFYNVGYKKLQRISTKNCIQVPSSHQWPLMKSENP